jgi:hypothetical protein
VSKGGNYAGSNPALTTKIKDMHNDIKPGEYFIALLIAAILTVLIVVNVM